MHPIGNVSRREQSDGSVRWSSCNGFGGKVASHRVFLKQIRQHLQPAVQIVAATKRNQDGRDLSGLRCNHGAFGIAGRAAVRSERVAEKWKILKVEIVLAYTFIGFTSATCAEDNVAFHFAQIVQ